MGIWNRSLSYNEIQDLYNGGAGIQYSNAFGGMTVDSAKPINWFNTTSSTIEFGCNASGTGGTLGKPGGSGIVIVRYAK
jgi:hypothetical protein